MDLVERVAPTFQFERLGSKRLLVGQGYLLSCGITGWQDADVRPEQEDAYLASRRPGRAHRRRSSARCGGNEIAVSNRSVSSSIVERGLAPRYRPTSVKLMLDGIVENYTAAMLEPYLDFDGQPTDNTGIDFIEPQALNEIVRRLDRLGFQCHFHAIGGRAVRHALDAIEAMADHDVLTHHLAHLQVVDPADVPRFAKVNAIANCQPLWACREPQMTDLTLPFLGQRSAANQYPFRSLAKAGTTLAMGSDWSVSTANVYEQIDVAVTRTHPAYRQSRTA